MGEGISTIKSESRQRGVVDKATVNNVIRKFEKNYRHLASTIGGVPISYSFFGGLNERTRREKYPFVNNIGEENTQTVYKYILAKSIRGGAQGVANALNNAGFATKNWKPVNREDGGIEVRAKDVLGNERRIVIQKKR